MNRGIRIRVKAVLASLSKQGSDDDSSVSSRGRSIGHSRPHLSHYSTEPIPTPKSKFSNSKSRSRSGHRTRRWTTHSSVQDMEVREGEKKLGAWGRMKADFKDGWDRRIQEEEERLESKRREMAKEKERGKRARGRKKVSVREKRERAEMEWLGEVLENVTLNGGRRAEGREYEQYLHCSNTTNNKNISIQLDDLSLAGEQEEDACKRMRSRNSIVSLGSGSSNSSATTIGRGILGDMDRTFIEGMIMPDQLREIERREKEERLKEAESS